MLPAAPSLVRLAEIIQLAIAPVFLLAGLGAFLNVCVGRLARIVDRSRKLEPQILSSRGGEHDRLLEEIRLVDRRIRVVNFAIFLTVLAAVMISLVVILLFLAFLVRTPLSQEIALLFILTMLATAGGFTTFLFETRLATKAVRVRSHILDHREDADTD